MQYTIEQILLSVCGGNNNNNGCLRSLIKEIWGVH